MANEESYIHPIIQGFLQGAAQMREQGQFQKNLEQRQLEHQDEVKERAEQIKVARERIEQAHKFHTDQLELSKQNAKLQADQYRLQSIDFVNRLGESGVDIKKAFGVQGQQMPNVPGMIGAGQEVNPNAGMIRLPGGSGEMIPAESFATPEKVAGILAGRRSAEVTAERKATQPFDIEAENRRLLNQKEVKKDENAFTLKLEAAKAADTRELHRLDREAMARVAAATNATTLRAAEIAHGITPGQLQAGVLGAAMGRIKLDGNNVFERRSLEGLQQAGLVPIDPKVISDLKSTQTLTDDYFQKIEDFGKKYLPSEKDSKLANVKAKLQGVAIKSGILPTDAANEIAQIKANALNLGKALEGMTGGRVTIQQLNLDLNALTDPGITEEQQSKLVGNIKKMYKNKIQDVLLGGVPEAQKRMLFEGNGVPGESIMEHGGKKYIVKYNPRTKEHDVIGEVPNAGRN